MTRLTQRTSRLGVVLGMCTLACATATVPVSDTEGSVLLFQYPFQNPDLPEEERVTDLIGRMTLEEKIAVLGWGAAVPRLGVEGSPHIEGYHGVGIRSRI